MQFGLLSNTFFLFLFVVFICIGFFGDMYYLEHEARFTKPVYSTAEIIRASSLTHRLQQVEYENADLESQIAELNLRAAQFYENQSYMQAQQLARFIGLLQQEGPGVEIVLKDSSKPLLLGDNPNTGIVHNTDLVQVINELRAAGAKAVAINNQPVVSQTGINCSGPIILVNGTRIASPFVIQALGDPKQIIRHLEHPSSFLKELKKFGIDVAVTQKNVVIPAYSRELAG